MRSLTKTGIRILSAKYRSILIKCAIINASVFIGAFGAGSVMAGNLPAVIQDKNISSYTLTNGDETLTSDLGTLAGSGRIFTINGNGHALKGADTHAGIALEEGQTLTLDNVNMENFQSGDNGGAVYNNGGTITNITGNFKDNSSTDLDGGAIANDRGTIINITGDFEGNFANNGGAINNVGTLSNITITSSAGDIQFKDNYAKDSGGHGGAINSDSRSTVNIIANDGNITFDGNYVTSPSGKGGAIYNSLNSTIGLYADKDHMISFVGGTETDKYDIDGIYNAGTLNVNGNRDDKVYAGTVNLYTVSDAATPSGKTNIYGGTINVKDTFIQKDLNLNAGTLNLGKGGTVTNLNANGGTLSMSIPYDTFDNYTNKISTLTVGKFTGTLNNFTVDFDPSKANEPDDCMDKISVGAGSIGTIKLTAVNVLNNSALPPDTITATYLTGETGSILTTETGNINSAVDGYIYTFTFDGAGKGNVLVTMIEDEQMSLPEAIAKATMNSYSANLNPVIIYSDLGTLAGDGRDFTIFGNGSTIDGNGHAGITINNGQTFTLNNADMKNFNGLSGAIDNSGITNIISQNGESITFSNNTGVIGGAIISVISSTEGENSRPLHIEANGGNINFTKNSAATFGGGGVCRWWC